MENHAIDNARGWLETMQAMVAKLDSAVADDPDAQDAAREEIQEAPLSVQVRSGWHNPGAEEAAPEEFEVLLTTGGPALRIIGDLDGYAEPTSAKLQWQDWGTPWTDYATTLDEDRALMSFVGAFWFGE